MMTSFVVYEVEYYDEDAHEEAHRYGLLNGMNYSDALEDLENWYGKDNIVWFKMYGLEDGPLEISNRLADEIIHGKSYNEVIN